MLDDVFWMPEDPLAHVFQEFSVIGPNNYRARWGPAILQGWIKLKITHEGSYAIKERNQTKPFLVCVLPGSNKFSFTRNPSF